MPTLGEAIPFVDFLMTQDLLILERATPDTVGARRIGIPFQNIATLKYTEPLKTEQFIQAGYCKGNQSAPAAQRPKKVPIQPTGQPTGQAPPQRPAAPVSQAAPPQAPARQAAPPQAPPQAAAAPIAPPAAPVR